MANMSAKFYEEAHNSFVSIMSTSFFHILYIVTLTFDPENKGIILSLWLTCLPNFMKHTKV